MIIQDWKDGVYVTAAKYALAIGGGATVAWALVKYGTRPVKKVLDFVADKQSNISVEHPEVEIISRDNGSLLKRKLFNLRQSFTDKINRVVNFPENNLMNGILLGERGGFDSKQNEEFINTSTIHIVALSGYNITIVSENVMKFFNFFLSQNISLYLGIVSVILFVIMAGAQATAVRAGIMALIALFARMTGRNYQAGRALVIAGLLMVAYDIRVLNDMSFQLSFLATIGVIFLAPKMIYRLRFLTDKFNLRDLIATTISANILVLPLILYATGVLSIVALPSNILILPIIPLAMFFGFLAISFSFISPTLALPFGFLGYLILNYVLKVVHFFANLPFASFHIKSFPLLLMILVYIFIFYFTFRKSKRIEITKPD